MLRFIEDVLVFEILVSLNCALRSGYSHFSAAALQLAAPLDQLGPYCIQHPNTQLCDI